MFIVGIVTGNMGSVNVLTGPGALREIVVMVMTVVRT